MHGIPASLQLALARGIKAAKRGVPVLLLGEPGAGKTWLAKKIHEHGPQDGDLVHVNIAELNPHAIESAIFGHVRGAYTGAHADQAGRLETAIDGSFLIDEIGDLPTHLQAKLLRPLEEGEFSRMGETRSRTVKCHIILATNAPRSQIRKDLRSRCRIIQVPPLRERPSGIDSALDEVLAELGATCPDSARKWILGYHWPENVRQLRMAVRLSLDDEDAVDLAELQDVIAESEEAEKVTEANNERPILGSYADACAALGLSKNTLRALVASSEARGIPCPTVVDTGSPRWLLHRLQGWIDRLAGIDAWQSSDGATAGGFAGVL